MIGKKISAIGLLFFITACSGNNIQNTTDSTNNKIDKSLSARVIYGDDDRLDLFEVTDPTLYNLARSTAVLMYADQLKADGDKYNIISSTFKQEFSLCSTEKFGHQYSAGFCSGFLIADNILVTAGHCVRNQSGCDRTSFVFDYAVNDGNDPGPSSVSSSQVYSCKQLIKSFTKYDGADYAVIELDKAVTDRLPLSVRTDGKIKINEPLVVVGYPSGIPMKVAGGANVRHQASGYFVANLDTYGGNSGSAVFNADTGLVEGILVRGEGDFVVKDGCRVSNVCENNACRGEDVTRIEYAVSSLKRSVRKRIQSSK